MAEFVVTSPDGKEKYKVTVSDEELQRSFEQRQPAPSTDYGPLRDVGRGLARGAIEGPTSDVAGTFGDIESIARRGGESLGFEPSGNAAPTSAELSERLGIGLRPTTPYGEVAETVARSVTNPANYIFGPVEATLGRTLARRGAGAAASGLGAGLGEQTGIPGAGVAGAVLGSTAADLAPEATARRRYKAELGRALTQEELFDVGSQLHQKLQDINTPIPGGDVQRDLVQPIRALFKRRQFFREDEPKTFRELGRITQDPASDSQLTYYRLLLDNPATDAGVKRSQLVAAAEKNNDLDMMQLILQNKGQSGVEAAQRLVNERLGQVGTPIESNEIYAVRTALRKVAQNNRGNSEGKAAGLAMDMIDDYLEKLPDYDEMKTARAVWRAARSSERYTEALRTGEQRADVSGSGANTANTLRQEIKKIRNNRKIPREPIENELMDEITHGTDVANWARTLSKLGPRHPLSGWGTTLAAVASGHADAGLATMFLGHVLQYVSEQSTRGGIEELEQTVRRRAPPSVARYGPPPERPGPFPTARTGSAAALRGATEALRPGPEDDALQ